MSTVLIKQIPDDYADLTGLAKYNRSRMPKCKDTFQVGKNYDDTFTTGLTKKEEETYGSILRKDVSNTSNFWEQFSVTIDADRPRTFDTTIALDNLALKMLIANRYIAPDKEAAFTPTYREAQYYAYTEETENAEEISGRKKRDKAIGLLLTISENKDKLLLYGRFLEGLKYTDQLSTETLYKMLRAFIEEKELKNATNFIAALETSIEQIQQKIVIDKAIKHRLIAKNGVGKKQVYQYGQVTLGNTLQDVYTNLTTPDFAPELMSLIKELENKKDK